MIKPIRDLILVCPEKESEKTESGFFIPDNAKEKQMRGVVIDIGGDVSEVKPGDSILFGKYAGTEVEMNGKQYLIFKEDDVMGVIS